MSDQFLGELRLMAFNFAPRGWAMSNGTIMSIQQNAALFSLLGTSYGGNGVQTFALPDLRGRVPVGVGTGLNGISYQIGQMAGEENHTLIMAETPPHTHSLKATSTNAITASPSSALLAAGGLNAYGAATSLVGMNASMLSNAGGSQPHSNQQPYLVMTWCIALTGIFPTRS